MKSHWNIVKVDEIDQWPDQIVKLEASFKVAKTVGRGRNCFLSKESDEIEGRSGCKIF